MLLANTVASAERRLTGQTVLEAQPA
jgi:hypothetical protein